MYVGGRCCRVHGCGGGIRGGRLVVAVVTVGGGCGLIWHHEREERFVSQVSCSPTGQKLQHKHQHVEEDLRGIVVGERKW